MKTLMLNLIIAIILASIFAYFALQNATPVLVSLGGNVLSIPLYAVAFLSLMVGVTISALLSFSSWISSSWELSTKNSQIRKEVNTITELKNHISALQIENAELRGETLETRNEARIEKDLAVERAKQPSFFDRLRYKLAI